MSLMRQDGVADELLPSQLVEGSEAVIRHNLRASLLVINQMAELVIREARRWLGKTRIHRTLRIG
jgi:hypothetical protein